MGVPTVTNARVVFVRISKALYFQCQVQWRMNCSDWRKMTEADALKLGNEGALHVVWTFPFADSVSVSSLHSRLIAGQESRLFDIRLWDCRDGQVSAILVPEAPFEDIVAHIWSTGHKPTGLWVEEKAGAPGPAQSNMGPMA